LRSYDGGDTGFLNAYFPGWYGLPPAHRLPFAYNAQRTLHWLTYDKQPGYWEAVGQPKILHFSSSPKPWESGAGGRKGPLEMAWWQAYLAAQAAGLG
jgi:glycogenin glucosyltransferase